MEETRTTTANLPIGNRVYRIKIEADKEAMVRSLIKKINEKITQFKIELAGKDMQDFVSMVLLWYVTQAEEPTDFSLTNEAIEEQLNKIQTALDKGLAIINQ